ncbi:methyltransferase domain-containing protein, partial [Mycobacterium tuberculosis]|nr:methyltransferase domain-containing protein [Mycobacterium tuberculosis]
GDLVRRPRPGVATGLGKIPWQDADFSRRMLAEHLSQAHDWASRRSDVIARQVDYLDRLLPQKGGCVLDLGCGPGFYTHRLAARGHHCVGIDFGPAAIDYAVAHAVEDDLAIDY